MNNVIIVPCYNEANRLNGNEFDKFTKTNPDINSFL